MPENKKLRPILVRLGSQALTAVEMQSLAALDGTNARHGIPEEKRSAAEANQRLLHTTGNKTAPAHCCGAVGTN
jgi:hypothetical protein